MPAANPQQVRDEAMSLLEESRPWLELLTPLHFQGFMAKFAEAIAEAIGQHDTSVLTALLEEWERTAEADAGARVSSVS